MGRELDFGQSCCCEAEIVRQFEGDEVIDLDLLGEYPVVHERRPKETRTRYEEDRGGARSRIGFRSRTSMRLRRFKRPDRPSTRNEHHEEMETRPATSMGGKLNKTSRPGSALGFRDIGSLRQQFAMLKRKLTNPWHRREEK